MLHKLRILEQRTESDVGGKGAKAVGSLRSPRKCGGSSPSPQNDKKNNCKFTRQDAEPARVIVAD